MIDLGQPFKCVISGGGFTEFSYSSCVKIVRFITEILSGNLGTDISDILIYNYHANLTIPNYQNAPEIDEYYASVLPCHIIS